ncbi:KTSC domain-containing protein [Hufsiella ginkgonis]|uniref:KTSC domain-containing protein n=1 Tax=Hufsiella ginkgonis TaxID=2695274 RepID=A0A7K1XU92_9SPHI|nr:KTSC domain-containing protein [Hufsiella ginkgonis]MXV14367.1 KTSC domain-containing protein [Hufsiella ginkgonis]
MPSSVIASMDYDPQSLALTIRYVSGLVYEYKQVPEEVFKQLKIAGSKGRFLNFFIKGKYDYEKVEKH